MKGYRLYGYGRLWLASLGLLLLLGATSAGSGAARAEAQATCDVGLQEMVDLASPGETIDVPACLFRESVTVDKPLTLEATPGAEIRGSDVWTKWKRKSGRWTSAATVPAFYTHGQCDPGTKRCLWAEQVFLDGQPLAQVASKPSAGQFAVDRSRRVTLGQNPTGKTVEVTTRDAWVQGEADNVTVRGFRMRHSANDAQTGAVDPEGHSYWTIEDNILSDAHGAVVSLDDGHDNALIGNDVSRGGQQGVNGNGEGDLVQANKIHANNTEGFSTGWEAGGLKMALAKDLTLDANEVYDNKGPGLWCDIDCENVTYSNNRIHHNQNAGIFFEISDGAKIYGNKLWENGWGYRDWGWGAGILVSSSKNAEVYDNTLAWNADGITIISQDRPADFGEAVDRWKTVTGNDVHDNAIIREHACCDYWDNLALAWLQDWDGVMFGPASNNRAAYNRYWHPSAEDEPRFAWADEDYARVEDFNATPGEENSRYLTDAEKDQTLAAAGLPRSPEPR